MTKPEIDRPSLEEIDSANEHLAAEAYRRAYKEFFTLVKQRAVRLTVEAFNAHMNQAKEKFAAEAGAEADSDFMKKPPKPKQALALLRKHWREKNEADAYALFALAVIEDEVSKKWWAMPKKKQVSK